MLLTSKIVVPSLSTSALHPHHHANFCIDHLHSFHDRCHTIKHPQTVPTMLWMIDYLSLLHLELQKRICDVRSGSRYTCIKPQRSQEQGVNQVVAWATLQYAKNNYTRKAPIRICATSIVINCHNPRETCIRQISYMHEELTCCPLRAKTKIVPLHSLCEAKKYGPVSSLVSMETKSTAWIPNTTCPDINIHIFIHLQEWVPASQEAKAIFSSEPISCRGVSRMPRIMTFCWAVVLADAIANLCISSPGCKQIRSCGPRRKYSRNVTQCWRYALASGQTTTRHKLWLVLNF